MWDLNYKESWAPKNWCFWRRLESSLDCKEIQPVHPGGDQSWVFIGRADVEAVTPILWPPDRKIRLIWKDPDAVKDRGQEEKGTAEDEMVGWHHRLDGHGFRWNLGVSDRQWGHGVTKSQTRLSDWTDLIQIHVYLPKSISISSFLYPQYKSEQDKYDNRQNIISIWSEKK